MPFIGRRYYDSGRILQLDQAMADGVEHSLGSSGHLELAKDPGEMGLHGSLGDDELFGYLVIAQPTAQGLQDLQLAPCQIRSRLSLISLALGKCAEQAPKQGRGHQRLAGRHTAYGLHDFGRGCIFDQKPVSAGLHRPEQDLIFAEAGQDQDGHFGGEIAQTAGGFHPVHPVHAHVHEHQIGVQLLNAGDGLIAVDRLSNHDDIGIHVEHDVQGLPHNGVVFHHEDADRPQGAFFGQDG